MNTNQHGITIINHCAVSNLRVMSNTQGWYLGHAYIPEEQLTSGITLEDVTDDMCNLSYDRQSDYLPSEEVAEEMLEYVNSI